MYSITDEEVKLLLKKSEKFVESVDSALQPVAFELVYKTLLGSNYGINFVENEELKVFSPQKHVQNSIPEISIPEILKKSQAKSYTDQFLIISYCLLKKKHLEAFNVNFVKSNLRDALLPIPGNPNDILNSLIKKGYLIKAQKRIDNLKGFKITRSGIEEAEKILKINNDH